MKSKSVLLVIASIMFAYGCGAFSQVGEVSLIKSPEVINQECARAVARGWLGQEEPNCQGQAFKVFKSDVRLAGTFFGSVTSPDPYAGNPDPYAGKTGFIGTAQGVFWRANANVTPSYDNSFGLELLDRQVGMFLNTWAAEDPIGFYGGPNADFSGELCALYDDPNNPHDCRNTGLTAPFASEGGG